jgi:hypothetical protein
LRPGRLRKRGGNQGSKNQRSAHRVVKWLASTRKLAGGSQKEIVPDCVPR